HDTPARVLFRRSRRPTHLPSFPTRRSSDLPGPVVQANAALDYLQEHAADFGGDMSRIFIGGDSAGAQIASQLSAVLSNSELATSDRKSTRLNSSHVKISYAVFCLKKKNTKK